MLAALACLVGASSVAGAFQYTPPSVELSLPPGGQRTFTIHLMNDEPESLRFAVRAVNVREDPRGRYEFSESETGVSSCKDWISVGETEVVVGPQEHLAVPCQVAVPRGADSRGYYGAVICELLPEPLPPKEPGAARMQIDVRYQTSSLVFLTVTGGRLQKKASISQLEVKPREGGEPGIEIHALVRNEGAIHVFAQGDLLIRDASGRRVRACQLGSGRGAILPGAQLQMSTIYPRNLAPGQYQLEARVKYGAGRPAMATLPFTVEQTALVGGDARGGVAFSVEPEEPVTLELLPRAFRAVVAEVRNFEPQPVNLTVACRDIQLDLHGETEIAEHTSYSCASWLSATPSEFVLPPEGRKQVKLTIRAPAEAAGRGWYAGVVFSARTEEGGMETSQIVPLLVTAPGEGLEKTAEIENVTVTRAATGSIRVDAYLRNTGTVHLAPETGRVLIKSLVPEQVQNGVRVLAHEQDVETIQAPLEGLLLPLGTREFGFASRTALEPGRYAVEVTLDYGGEGPAALRREFLIAPPADGDSAAPGPQEAAPPAGVEV